MPGCPESVRNGKPIGAVLSNLRHRYVCKVGLAAKSCVLDLTQLSSITLSMGQLPMGCMHVCCPINVISHCELEQWHWERRSQREHPPGHSCWPFILGQD